MASGKTKQNLLIPGSPTAGLQKQVHGNLCGAELKNLWLFMTQALGKQQSLHLTALMTSHQSFSLLRITESLGFSTFSWSDFWLIKCGKEHHQLKRLNELQACPFPLWITVVHISREGCFAYGSSQWLHPGMRHRAALTIHLLCDGGRRGRRLPKSSKKLEGGEMSLMMMKKYIS